MNRKQFLHLFLLALAQRSFAEKAVLKSTNSKVKKNQYIITPYKMSGLTGFQVYNFKTNQVTRHPTSEELHGLFHVNEDQIILISKRSNKCVVYDLNKATILTEFESSQNRIFYGHGCVDQNGYVYISQADKSMQGYLSKRHIQNISKELEDIKIEGCIGIHECKFDAGLIYIAGNGDQKNVPGSITVYDPADKKIKSTLKYLPSELGPQHFYVDENNMYTCSSSFISGKLKIDPAQASNSIHIYNKSDLTKINTDLSISKKLGNACLSIISDGAWIAGTSSSSQQIIVKSLLDNTITNEYSQAFDGGGCIKYQNYFIFFSAVSEPYVFDFKTKIFSQIDKSALKSLNINEMRSNSHAYLV